MSNAARLTETRIDATHVEHVIGVPVRDTWGTEEPGPLVDQLSTLLRSLPPRELQQTLLLLAEDSATSSVYTNQLYATRLREALSRLSHSTQLRLYVLAYQTQSFIRRILAKECNLHYRFAEDMLTSKDWGRQFDTQAQSEAASMRKLTVLMEAIAQQSPSDVRLSLAHPDGSISAYEPTPEKCPFLVDEHCFRSSCSKPHTHACTSQISLPVTETVMYDANVPPSMMTGPLQKTIGRRNATISVQNQRKALVDGIAELLQRNGYMALQYDHN